MLNGDTIQGRVGVYLHSIVAGLNAHVTLMGNLTRDPDLHSIVAGLNAEPTLRMRHQLYDLHSIVAGLNAQDLRAGRQGDLLFTFHCGWIECPSGRRRKKLRKMIYIPLWLD